MLKDVFEVATIKLRRAWRRAADFADDVCLAVFLLLIAIAVDSARASSRASRGYTTPSRGCGRRPGD